MRLLGGFSQKTNIDGWGRLKSGVWTVFQFKGVLARNSGVKILRGEVETQCTLCSMFKNTFLTFFSFYINKNQFFCFSLLFCDEISNIRNRILTIQKPE